MVGVIRRARRIRGATSALLAVVLLCAWLGAIVPTSARADETTVSTDSLRTGWDRNEPGLSPASVQSSDFGQLFATQLDGQVYAQPITVAGTLIAATENDKVYGLDPVTGAVKWSRDVGPYWPSSAIGCGDLAPDVGITSTPVYDPASGAVYFTAKVNDGVDDTHPHYYLHAVDPGTGAEKAGFPVTIAGAPSNDPTLAFDPYRQMQRPGLLLLGGVVYMGFGSHCDFGPYRGYVVGVSTTTAKITAMWASETGSSNEGGGIWQAGGGLVSDGAGRIFVATGNGINPPAGPGSSPPGTLSESVVRLQVQSDGSLAAADFFSPANAPTLDLNDTDLASGGGMALPDGFGTTAHPHLLVQQGKDGRVFLLDRDNLGGRSQGAGGTDAVVGTTGPFQGQWGHPAFWGGDGGYVYLVDNGGPLRALKYGLTGSGDPALTLTGTSTDTFPYTSGSPVVTSTGTSSGSALVWVVQSTGPTGANSTLRAYNPVPDANGNLALVWSTPIGTAAKFATPGTDGNRIYVGTRDGMVLGYGRPATTAVNGSPVDFGSIATGATAQATAVLTASQALTVTGLSTAAPFTVTPPALPVSLAAGQQLSVPLSFSPTAAGVSNGTLQVATSAGSFALSLTGTGTQAGLAASPAGLTFGQVPTGSSRSLNVQITNTGTASETLGSVTGPQAPFSSAGLPAVGSSIAAGASVVVPVTYTPTAAGSNSSSLVLTSTSGTITVPITGEGIVGKGQLVFTPSSLSLGSVAVGSAQTASFDITNTGNIPVTVTKAKAPNGDFTSATPLSEGLVIGPGQVVHQSVTFTPSAPGTQGADYEVTGDAGQGAMLEHLTGTGTGTLPAPAAATWSANGSALLPGDGSISLTGQTTQSAGSSFYTRPVPSAGLTAAFTAQLGPGTGADGESLTLLDASKGTPAGLGATGGGLGTSGLAGVSVDLVTTWNSQAGYGNFVGVSTGGSGDSLTYLATAKVPTALRTGTHQVAVTVVGTHLKVSVDGTQLLDTTPPLPDSVYPGFTAATGAQADAHSVSAVTITTGAAPVGQALTAAPASLDFGTVATGTSTSLTAVLTNNGAATEHITATSAPAPPFTAVLPATGTTVAPGASLSVPVTYAPTAAGTQTGSLALTSTSGTVTLALTGTGMAVATGGAPVPGPTDASWARNGQATLSGTTLALTTAASGYGAGSSFYPTPVPTNGLHASFTAQLNGGTGGDGLALALLDPAQATATALGQPGSGLGFLGLPGTAVALDTAWNSAVGSGNFVGISQSTPQSTGNPSFLASAKSPTSLRTGTHTVTVDYTGGHLKVALDGTQLLDQAVTLPPDVLVGFTGANGGSNDNHLVSNVAITAGKQPTSTLPAFGDATWTSNGTTTLAAGTATLTTDGQTYTAGSIVNSTPVNPLGLDVSFTAQISGTGAKGADGLALALLDPATSGPTSLGGTGGQLGTGGLAAVYAALATYPGDAISIGTSTVGGTLTTLASAAAPTPLRGTGHTVEVKVTTASHLLVLIDGVQVLDQSVSLPPQVLVAFTGGNGSLTDTHQVTSPTISYSGGN